MILMTILSLCAGGGYCWWIRLKRYTPADQPVYKYLAIASYVLWGLAGLVFIAMCCCCGAIKVGIAVMKATAKFIGENLRIFLLPFSSYVILFIWLGLWGLGGLYLWTVGYSSPRVGYEFSTEIVWDKYTKYVLIYYVFGLFWVNAFVVGMT